MIDSLQILIHVSIKIKIQFNFNHINCALSQQGRWPIVTILKVRCA